MFDIERWLRLNLLRASGDAAEVSLLLTKRLLRLAKRFGFEVLLDVWISSRFEEAEVRVKFPCWGAKDFAVCFVPIKLTDPRWFLA